MVVSNLFHIICWCLLIVECIHAQNNSTNSSSSSSSTGSEDTLRCVPLSVEGAFCAQYVNYLVPSDVNQTIAAALAEANDDWRVTGDCPYYGNMQYQCYKWFPLCVNTSGTAVVPLLCQSLCYGARTYSDGLCSSYTSGYFDAECQDSSHYSTASDCWSPSLRLSAGSSTNDWWKWLLVAICVAVGLALLFTVLRRCYRDHKVSPNLTDEDIRRDFQGPPAPKRPAQQEYAQRAPNPKREAVFQAVVAQGGR